MSQLVQGFLDSDQAGLEDSDVGLRVTSADSCPHFPGFVLLAQQLPERGLRVTARPKQQETPPADVARGTPAAADDPRRESPGDPSRDEHAPCASAARGHTPTSSSSGFLQQIVGGDTTSGRTDTVSTSTSSQSPSTQRGRRPPRLFGDYSAAKSDTWGGSILPSRPGSLLESAEASEDLGNPGRGIA